MRFRFKFICTTFGIIKAQVFKKCSKVTFVTMGLKEKKIQNGAEPDLDKN